jgi:PAS domain S-box-containing protein
MNRAFSSLHQHVARMRVAYAVLMLSLIATAVVYYRVKVNVEAREKTRFERVVGEKEAAIEQRIPRYVDEILGVRGLFAANGTVNSDQWQKYLGSMDIQRLYPGIRSLGYVAQVKAGERKDFLKWLRASGNQELHIQPEGEREIYFPVVYLNHFNPNLTESASQDHFSDNERRKTMDRARDDNQPTATDKIAITIPGVTNGHRVGFVIYLPVYHAGAAINTVTERRAALQGLIFADIEPDALLAGMPGEQPNPIVDCEIFDGPEMTKEHLLHDDDKILHAAETRPHQRIERVTIPVLNRSWTLYFSSLPQFELESQHNLPVIALICWLTLSFLLFGLTMAEVKSRARAAKITADLRKSEAALAAETERLAVTLYSIGDGVVTTDIDGQVISLNKVAEQLTGWNQAEAAGKLLGDFFKLVNETTREECFNPAYTVLQTGAVFNRDRPAILIARDGTERAIADSAAPIRNREGGIIGTVVVFRDVTARQKTEAELLKEHCARRT